MPNSLFSCVFGHSSANQEETLFLSWSGRKELNEKILHLSGAPPSTPIFAVFLSEEAVRLLASELLSVQYTEESEKDRDLTDLARLYLQIKQHGFQLIYYSKTTETP